MSRLRPSIPLRAVSAAARRLGTHAGRERLVVLDTTLRDGACAPGLGLTREDRLAIARQLGAMGVDVCEAGFPATRGDEEFGHLVEISAMARAEYPGMAVCALSRPSPRELDVAYEAVSAAPRHRLHTFLAASDDHLEDVLGMSRVQAVEAAASAVVHAAALCAGSTDAERADVEFTPYDATRADPAFVSDMLRAAAESGARVLSVPDSAGRALPEEFGALVAELMFRVGGGAGGPDATPGAGDGLLWSVHCHNDLGLATANSLAAVHAGARQVEATLLGVGERAGNAALEEIVAALRARPERFECAPADSLTEEQLAAACIHLLTLRAREAGVSLPPVTSVAGAHAHPTVRRADAMPQCHDAKQAPTAGRAAGADGD